MGVNFFKKFLMPKIKPAAFGSITLGSSHLVALLQRKPTDLPFDPLSWTEETLPPLMASDAPAPSFNSPILRVLKAGLWDEILRLCGGNTHAAFYHPSVLPTLALLFPYAKPGSPMATHLAFAREGKEGEGKEGGSNGLYPWAVAVTSALTTFSTADRLREDMAAMLGYLQYWAVLTRDPQGVTAKLTAEAVVLMGEKPPSPRQDEFLAVLKAGPHPFPFSWLDEDVDERKEAARVQVAVACAHADYVRRMAEKKAADERKEEARKEKAAAAEGAPQRAAHRREAATVVPEERRRKVPGAPVEA